MAGPGDPRAHHGSVRSRLVRAGFLDPDRSAERAADLGHTAPVLIPLLAATADPDGALDRLLDLAEMAQIGFLDLLVADELLATRLVSVLGASTAMADHLVRHPDHWHELADPDLSRTRPAAFAMRAALLDAVADKPDQEAVDALRVDYRRQMLGLMARDLEGLGVDDVAAELSDLAAGTLDAALEIARKRVGESASTCRLAVIAMGKCGGHELNYISDVDVIFVAEAADGCDEGEALKAATHLAANVMQVCGDQTAEGTIWPVDANLRPEGKAGPLVRTVASHLAYYERWAKTWEFQALLKARPVAGDLELGREYAEKIRPLIWHAAERDGFVPEVQAMRRRVVDNIPSADADRQLKLGSGGLRDVEFAVQLLQLVHGRADETIRAPTTLSALADLTRGGYVGREDGQAMHDAYAFLRTLEHRIQMYQLRRTHVVPSDEESLRRLGRSLGFLKDPVGQLDKAWAFHRREVRRLHEKLFYRPLLAAVARISTDEARLSPQSAKTRLKALGYEDSGAALRHIEALTAGLSRKAAIQRALLPAMLGWFADAPDPDAGLLGFRQLSDALGSTSWYLRMMRDEGQAASRLAAVLATSRYATDLIQREPEGVRLLGKDERLEPMSRSALETEMLAAVRRRDDVRDAVLAVRAIRRREILRISLADLTLLLDVDVVGRALTDLTSATLTATLAACVAHVERSTGEPLPTRMAIIAMGRYGGGEMGYGSDADVMFVHDPLPGADAGEAAKAAQAVAHELRAQLGAPASDPALEVDADLRPEGKQGPLARTIDSFRAYYAKWSQVWEAQALLRADATVGDEQLCGEFTELVDPLRFPGTGLQASDLREIRRIKARVDAERLPRGADPKAHFKLGPGGLSDIEWTVQALQMERAHEVPGLRTVRTIDALDAAVEAGLVEVADATDLRHAWLLASRLRNATVQVRGRPTDQLPHDARQLAAVSAVLQYPPGHTDEMVNDYLRATRRARAVVDRVFWG